jgi:hypothetical protein
MINTTLSLSLSHIKKGVPTSMLSFTTTRGSLSAVITSLTSSSITSSTRLDTCTTRCILVHCVCVCVCLFVYIYILNKIVVLNTMCRVFLLLVVFSHHHIYIYICIASFTYEKKKKKKKKVFGITLGSPAHHLFNCAFDAGSGILCTGIIYTLLQAGAMLLPGMKSKAKAN